MQIGRIKFRQQGQTMVDLIVALALLSAAVASAGALASTSSRSNVQAGLRSQATGLATREMEALRNLRDTNAQNQVSWADYMPNPTFTKDAAGCTGFYMRRTGDTWTETETAIPVAYSAANSGEMGDATFDTAYSAFSRKIKLCPMGPASDKVMKVEVAVSWQSDKPFDSEVVLRSLISDWDQAQ